MFVSLFWNYLSVSIGIGIAALIFLLLQKKLRSHYSAVSLSVVWILMACCLLLPLGGLTHTPIRITVPSATFNQINPPVSAQNQTDLDNPLPAAVETQSNQEAFAYDPQDATGEITAKDAVPNTVDWPRAISAVWLSGAVLFLVIHGIIYLTLRTSIRKNTFSCPDAILEIFESVKHDLSIQQTIPIGIYPPCKSPFLIGILRPMVLLPDNTKPESLEFILRHELMHYKNRDIFIKLLALFANALHFYNPIAYVIRHELSLSRELVCDEQTLKEQNAAYIHAYGNSILNCQFSVRQCPVTTQFGCTKNELKERLTHMLSFKSKKKGIVLTAILLVFTISASTVLAFSAYGTKKADLPQDTGTDANTGLYLDTGTDIAFNSTTAYTDLSLFTTDNTNVSETDFGNKTTFEVSSPLAATTAKANSNSTTVSLNSAVTATTTTMPWASTTINETPAPDGKITDFAFDYYTNPGNMEINGKSSFHDGYLFTNRQQMLGTTKQVKINLLDQKDFDAYVNKYSDSYFQTKSLVLLLISQPTWFENKKDGYITVNGMEINRGKLYVNVETVKMSTTFNCAVSTDIVFIEVNKVDVNGIPSVIVNL